MMRFVPTGGVTPATLRRLPRPGLRRRRRRDVAGEGARHRVGRRGTRSERLAREAAAIVAAGPRRADRGRGLAMTLAIKGADEARWDLVALGEVMLRLDPGEDRIHTARQFRAWEGGGEYNVARGLRRCFGLRTAIVTALADNPIGRLVEDMMLAGGVDLRHVAWVPYDGVGRSGPQRPQLHRARLRRARRGRRLRPRPHRGQPAAAGRRGLGRDLRDGRCALVPHRWHLRRALARRQRRWPPRPWPPPGGTGRSSATTSTTAPACGRASAARSRRRP